MIKKHELRIGNIVNCHFLTTNFNAAVLEVRYGGVLVQDGEYNNTYGYDNISPIELSPEILEKAGFEPSIELLHTLQVKDGLWIEIGEKSAFITVNEGQLIVDDSIILKYLHQLQNLYFSLTGEELIIHNYNHDKSTRTTTR